MSAVALPRQDNLDLMVSLMLRCLCCGKVFLISIIQKERETDVLVWLSRGWEVR